MDCNKTGPLVSDIVARPLIHGDHVTDNAGTGLVHTAPGHGHDDYFLGIEKFSLKQIALFENNVHGVLVHIKHEI